MQIIKKSIKYFIYMFIVIELIPYVFNHDSLDNIVLQSLVLFIFSLGIAFREYKRDQKKNAFKEVIMNSVLSIRGLTKKYDKFMLDQIDLDLYPGKITGLIGPNGAGKSTTMKLILKIIEADGGIIKFGETNVSATKEMTYKEKIGYVGENLDYFIKSDLKEIKKFYSSFFLSWDEALYQHLLTKFDLVEKYKMMHLSKGMRVKFALCLALAHRPKLLLMDEPTSGLDPLVRNEILKILKAYAVDNNASILFSSHITEDMTKIADDLVFIYGGKIVDRRNAKEIIEFNINIDEHLETLVVKSKEAQNVEAS